ncbi:hypothetical protein K8I61_04455 [bacterium]|nr:hypothetical protein [bacterium]
MKIARTNNPVPTAAALVLIAAASAGFWLLFIARCNTSASQLMHNNWFWGLWTYQKIHNLLPDDVDLAFLRSGYYLVSALSATAFGTAFDAFMYPNLIALVLVIFAAFFVGRELASARAGLCCAASMAFMPPVIGLAQAYEGTIVTFATLTWFLFFFVRWTRTNAAGNLAGALVIASAGILMPTTATFQALFLAHGIVLMAAFLAEASIAYARHGSHHKNTRIGVTWIGAASIVAAGFLVLMHISDGGRQFGYQLKQMEATHGGAERGFVTDLSFYPSHIVFKFLNGPAVAILALGTIVSARRPGPLLPLAASVVAAVAGLTWVGKLDPAYVLGVTPALGVLTGLAAWRIGTFHRFLAPVCVLLVALMAFVSVRESLVGRTPGFPGAITSVLDRPSYEFIRPPEFSERVFDFDRKASCLAVLSDAVSGEGRFSYPWVLIDPDLLFRAHASMARPRTFVFLPAGIPHGNDRGEPSKWSFDYFAVALDEETARLADFKDILAVWSKRTDESDVLDRYEALKDARNRFSLIGRGCGMAFYRLEK